MTITTTEPVVECQPCGHTLHWDTLGGRWLHAVATLRCPIAKPKRRHLTAWRAWREIEKSWNIHATLPICIAANCVRPVSGRGSEFCNGHSSKVVA